MSLATIAGKLTRNEMKNIMAGSGISNCSMGPCSVFSGGSTNTGFCRGNQTGNVVTCYCDAIGGLDPITSNGGLSRCWN
ncbi:hypothetical protein [Flavobacterium sp. 1]|uniref:hypothetical protein n=1 Tax=Flavobacterium sp. 1 TaxID=2035200 RepID=UPI0012FE5C06|nr:hypothetical protein [Flavobacterium sp. 1]